MAEMKTLNGYEIVDAAARERLDALEKAASAEGEASYTNLADPTSSDWKAGYRLNSSGTTTACSSCITTNFIPCVADDIIRIKGLNLMESTGGYVTCFDAAGNKVGDSVKLVSYPSTVTQVSDYEYIYTVGNANGSIYDWSANVARVRFSGALESAAKNVIITVNEEITEQDSSSVHEARIVSLENRVTVLEEGADSEETDTTVVPDYWQTAVDEAITKVKALQDEGGSDVVNFAWFSDMHYDGSSRYVKNVGVLCKAVMDACDIPLALMNGDSLTAGVLSTDDEVIANLEGTMDILAPIGDERLMLVRGNHDDVYGWYHPTGSYIEGSSVAYVNKVAPSKIWNKLHRPQAKDFRRVFGGDGTYFYLDNTPQKVRFVCLNGHYYDGEAVTDGTTKFMTTGFGTEQLDWLENVALAVDEGWGVVIATHAPVNSPTYLAQYSDGTAFCDIVNAHADSVIAIFSGHCHADKIFTGAVSCPNITVTCAADSTYDDTEADRTAGTATETVIDIVSINRATKTIHTTRLGVGSDREVSYTGGEHEDDGNQINLAGTITYDNRLNSSGVLKTSIGAAVTNYIPVMTGEVINIGGLDIMCDYLPDGANSPSIVIYSDTAGTKVAHTYPKSNPNAYSTADGVTTWMAFTCTPSGATSTTVTQMDAMTEGTQYYIRICGTPINGEEIIVTKG